MISISETLLKAGKTLYAEKKTTEAIECFHQSIKSNPDNREAHIHLAYALCRSGDYENGFKEFVWVWKPVFGDQTNLLSKEKKLNGKTILLSADAGLGDTIMFSRFSKELSARNCRVILHVQKPLVRLLQQSRLADLIISHDEVLPAHDLRIPFHNLMAALDIGNSLSSDGNYNYLSCAAEDVAYYEKTIHNQGRRKVGLCWQGNPDFIDDKIRSVSLEYLLKWTHSNDYIVSLVPNLPNDKTKDITSFSFKDIAQTAALIKNLDIVYTVDTMICHLCGALGVPAVLLNRFNGCWRWGESSEKSIWYQSVKIKHQQQFRNWEIDIQNI